MNKEHKKTIVRRMARAGIPFALAQTDSIKKNVVEIRQIVIQLLYFFESLTQQEIAELLHIEQSSVSRSMKAFRKKHTAGQPNTNFEKKYYDYRTKYKAAIQHDGNS